MITFKSLMSSNRSLHEGNKNEFLFAYLESFVEWGVFNEIVVDSLALGHTHEEIYIYINRLAPN